MAAPEGDSTADGLGRSFDGDKDFAQYVRKWLEDGCMCNTKIKHFELSYISLSLSLGSVRRLKASNNYVSDDLDQLLCQSVFSRAKVGNQRCSG